MTKVYKSKDCQPLIHVDTMSELNINELPPEMIMKILQFLDVRSLKNAALTCRLWNSLIESTCPWSLVLRDIDYEEQQKINFILTTNRKIGTITIEDVNLVRRTEIYKILREHGVNVVDLILDNCYIDSLNALADLLNLMPNLMCASISLIYVFDWRLDCVLPDMKKLKELEWFVRDHRLIRCFRKAKLTAMTISEDSKTIHYDSMVEFLSTQDTLTSLTVTNRYSSVSILSEMGKLNAPNPLRLTKLSINVHFGNYFYSDMRFDHDNLLRFFKSQTENLKHVEIGEGTRRSVYEPAFALTKLDTLIVSIYRLPKDKNFYAQLEKNHSVRTIELLGHFYGDVGFLCNFFEIFPNTRSLILRTIPRYISSKILATAQCLQKLESLSIGGTYERSFGCMKFGNLKSLYIRYLSGKIDWNQFTKNNSRLTEITIEKIHRSVFITYDDIEQITTNVDLQSIRLGDGFTAGDRFFEIVQAKCIRT